MLLTKAKENVPKSTAYNLVSEDGTREKDRWWLWNSSADSNLRSSISVCFSDLLCWVTEDHSCFSL